MTTICKIRFNRNRETEPTLSKIISRSGIRSCPMKEVSSNSGMNNRMSAIPRTAKTTTRTAVARSPIRIFARIHCQVGVGVKNNI